LRSEGRYLVLGKDWDGKLEAVAARQDSDKGMTASWGPARPLSLIVCRQEGFTGRATQPAHEERDQQFKYLQDWRDMFADAGLPIISVDTKKKELIGNFANAGATWSWTGDPVNAHDFRQDAQCRAAPYGIYDVLANRGHVTVGTSADTPLFAVDAIAGWWAKEGMWRHGGADMLLILADAGGSNGYRPRLWKLGLQEKLADRYGLMVTVCHYPTGASKWNPVEHGSVENLKNGERQHDVVCDCH
jgi:Rhodopirellula transposase DDE domain